MSFDFNTVRYHKLKFGKYKGMVLDDVANTDDGLKYLDWVRGQTWARNGLKKVIGVYLDDPAIARELERVLDDA